MGVRGQLSGLPPPLIGSYDTILGVQSSDVGAAGWTLAAANAAQLGPTTTALQNQPMTIYFWLKTHK